MYNKHHLIILTICIFGLLDVAAQECNLRINGNILDEASMIPLEFVDIFVQESSTGAVSDINGDFVIENVCPGEYHLNLSHIGCEGKNIRIDLYQDTLINIMLEHSPHELNLVVVEGKQNELNGQPSESVNRQLIEDNTNQNLASLLENQTGVHLLKNGSGIAKPVVQGLTGNRLTILNNGLVQSGQQWASDHSPEIDPFAADKITVLKGASSIEHGGGNLGAAVLIEPKPIEKEDHLHGQVNYAFESNGRGNTLNARLGQYNDSFGWRVSGTLKKYGDRRAPNYFLNNSGNEEANLAIQIEKVWNQKVFSKFYASTFNTRLGIFRGSQIGNLTDLNEALETDVPFFTEPNFSYDIDAPRQNVSHHLAKLEVKYFMNDKQYFDVVLGGQINNRKEFDVRRGSLIDRPSLSLLQFSYNADLKYTHELSNHLTFKLGTQNVITDNTNNPETGNLPLIPDYRSFRTGNFGTLSYTKKKFELHLGLRYEYESQEIVAIINDVPPRIERFNNDFNTLSSLFAAKLNLPNRQTLNFNLGYAMRPPGVNERFSVGLHQGVSGIEEGNQDIGVEKALKTSLEYKWVPSNNFSISSLLYLQHFDGYIFLNPQDEFRLTIRGAFPLFIYSQTDANIFGLDVSAQFTLGKSLLGSVKYSFIRGNDLTNDIPVVFIPPNSTNGKLIYRVEQDVNVSKNINFEELEFEANGRYVFRQNNLLPEQDFVLPPDAYFLLGLKVSTNIITPKFKFRFYVKADNALDTVYRDFLNRQRYFADDLGRSITLGISLKF